MGHTEGGFFFNWRRICPRGYILRSWNRRVTAAVTRKDFPWISEIKCSEMWISSSFICHLRVNINAVLHINFSVNSNRTECFRLLQQKLGPANKQVQTMKDYFAPNPFWNMHIQDISCMLSRFKPRTQTLCLLDVFCTFEITQFERIIGRNRKLKANLGPYKWFFFLENHRSISI